MRIRYTGIKGMKRTSGCSACGRRHTQRVDGVQYSTRMMLPSGRMVVFVLNHDYEVSEEDGNFLLEYTYNNRGFEEHPFVLS
ncbi:hypothetical protein [Faecalibaculum rodentium]|uniref:hypothetical protein n=2 Tax=Faecalibaculum rodentium TaxID=1702221 RepID=UPI00260321C3|nr:hypothetical protein [Faecalibaculum rodentium]